MGKNVEDKKKTVSNSKHQMILANAFFRKFFFLEFNIQWLNNYVL